MVRFQFDGDVDYFEIDPVAYAPALGKSGMAAYRARLSDIETGLGPRPAAEDLWTSRHSHEWFMIEWNARRLAVLDRDIDAIIHTHARDRKVAAWLEDTARAFEEIGEIDLAIGWAKQATDFHRGHQSLKAAGYWCELLAEHRPAELLPARLEVFQRWPSSSTAAHIYQIAGPSWPSYRDEVAAALAGSPRDAVLFALLTLKDVQLAWNLAYSLGLDSDQVPMSRVQPGCAVVGGRAGRFGQLGVKCAVVGGDQLPIGVATHPDCLLAQLSQPVEGLGRHRSGGYVAIEHDGIDSRRVDLIENCVECWQIAMNVGQHGDPH